MANKDIGYINCSECGCAESAVRESGKGKQFAYSICPECGHQAFCRSSLCDEKLRARMRPVVEAAPVVPDEPKPKEESKNESWFD